MRPYAERRAARIARLEARAAKLRAEGESHIARADARAGQIPMGQPILVGHHSERRDRNFRAKIERGFRRGFEALGEARELARRASAAEENTAISSDDPEALDKLRQKLAELELERKTSVEVNATIRAAVRRGKKQGEPWEPLAVAALVEQGLPRLAAEDLVEPDFCGRTGVPSYRLTNLGANIRRVAGRITALERQASEPEREPIAIGAVRIEESDNRVRIYFPGKPSEALRADLKRCGFRWAPSEGAWMRTPSYHARLDAQRIAAAATESAWCNGCISP